eukprot:scaffold6016_cov119-Isochrysis_galbana.AAC.13
MRHHICFKLSVIIDDVEGTVGAMHGADAAEHPGPAPLPVGPDALPTGIIGLDAPLRHGTYARGRDVLLEIPVVVLDGEDAECAVYGDDAAGAPRPVPAKISADQVVD